jgi:O-antigen ligase
MTLISYVLCIVMASAYPMEGIKEITIVSTNIFLAAIFAWLVKQTDASLFRLADLWCKMFAITALVAIVELVFDVHLPMSNEEESVALTYSGITLKRQFASVTFGNLNSYNTLVIFSGPFIVARVLLDRRSGFSWLCYSLFVVILLSNGTRAGAVFALIATAVLAFSLVRRGMGLLTFLILSTLISYILFSSGFATVSVLRIIGEGVTDAVRVELIRAGFSALEASNFLGVGPGNLQPILSSAYGLSLTAPHNVFLEVASQYGLVIAVVFFGSFSAKIIRMIKRGGSIDRSMSVLLLASLGLGGVVDSGHLDSLVFWVFFVSVIVVRVVNRRGGHEVARTGRFSQ